MHPVLCLDDAWEDTVDALWTPEADESAFKRGLLMPVMIVATPIVFLGDWLARSALPLESD